MQKKYKMIDVLIGTFSDRRKEPSLPGLQVNGDHDDNYDYHDEQ